ncbi:DUF6059 family protein [Streptacidiphilus sp. PAMC 29251]
MSGVVVVLSWPRRAARRWAALLSRWAPELVAFGCSLGGVSAPLPWPDPWWQGPTLADHPPPGHPERLCAHVPPTEAERELWSRLGLSA